MKKTKENGLGKIRAFFGVKSIWIPALFTFFGLFLLIGHVSTLLPFGYLPANIVAACFQAVITALMTMLLLKAQTIEQTESELKRDRFSVLFNKKSVTYDGFLSDLEGYANKGSMSPQEYRKLIDDVNFKLGMYLSNNSTDAIEAILDEVQTSPDEKTFKESLHKIVDLLRKDLNVEL